MCYTTSVHNEYGENMYKVDSFKFVVDEKLAQAQKQISNLEKCKGRPHILDNKTVQRLIEVYRQEKQMVKHLMITSRSTLQGELSYTDRQTMKQVDGDIHMLANACDQILFLADHFQEHTIDKIIEKTDIELAVDVLMGKHYKP